MGIAASILCIAEDVNHDNAEIYNSVLGLCVFQIFIMLFIELRIIWILENIGGIILFLLMSLPMFAFCICVFLDYGKRTVVEIENGTTGPVNVFSADKSRHTSARTVTCAKVALAFYCVFMPLSVVLAINVINKEYKKTNELLAGIIKDLKQIEDMLSNR